MTEHRTSLTEGAKTLQRITRISRIQRKGSELEPVVAIMPIVKCDYPNVLPSSVPGRSRVDNGVFRGRLCASHLGS